MDSDEQLSEVEIIMGDEDSSSTSCDDRSEFNENPIRDALADGLMSFLKPRVDNLYKLVAKVKESQIRLKSELDATFVDLDNILKEDDGLSANFQKYSDKIAEMRHQITVIDNVLQAAHGRLENFTGKMHALQTSRKSYFDDFENAKKNTEPQGKS